MARMVKKTKRRQTKFLASVAKGATISKAAHEIGVVSSTVYKWRQQDDDFACEWDQAIESGTDMLEDEAFRRALNGVERPVFYGGKPVGYVRDYSDSLLVFMLKARRPEKFKDIKPVKSDLGVEERDHSDAKERLISKLVQATASSEDAENPK